MQCVNMCEQVHACTKLWARKQCFSVRPGLSVAGAFGFRITKRFIYHAHHCSYLLFTNSDATVCHRFDAVCDVMECEFSDYG